MLDIALERILHKGRLQPGRMFLIDTEEGRIVADEEIKTEIVTEHPYREWIDKYMVELARVPDAPHLPESDHDTVLRRQQAFGYTFEDLRILMGADGEGRGRSRRLDGHGHAAGGVVRSKPQPRTIISSSFLCRSRTRRLTASARRLITSAEELTIGSERNLLKATPESCRLIELKSLRS